MACHFDYARVSGIFFSTSNGTRTLHPRVGGRVLTNEGNDLDDADDIHDVAVTHPLQYWFEDHRSCEFADPWD